MEARGGLDTLRPRLDFPTSKPVSPSGGAPRRSPSANQPQNLTPQLRNLDPPADDHFVGRDTVLVRPVSHEATVG